MEEKLYEFCYMMSPTQLNEQLDNFVLDRWLLDSLRNLARSRSHLEANTLKGNEHAHEMVDLLNSRMNSKGIRIKSVIIEDVKLPPDFAKTLSEKTTYFSNNELQRKKQGYELMVIVDDQENDFIKKIKSVDRQKEDEIFKQQKADIEKDHKKIVALTEKLVSEIRENKIAKVNQITTNGELLAENLRAEIKLIETKIIADGKAECQRIDAETDAYCQKKEAEASQEAAEKRAAALRYSGEVEKKVFEMMAKKREFESEMRNLSVLYNLASNPNVTLFGEGNNLLALTKAFEMSK